MQQAFLPGEPVKVAADNGLPARIAKYRNAQEVLARVQPHIGQRLTVTSCSFPHGAGVLYTLEKINGYVWQECLEDYFLDEDGDPGNQRASSVYKISASEEEEDGLIQITDNDGRVFCKLRRSHTPTAIEEITAIAQIRSRSGFENRFNFHGDYTPQRG
jgi:hypothetical protein